MKNIFLSINSKKPSLALINCFNLWEINFDFLKKFFIFSFQKLPSYDTPKPGPPSDMYGTDEAPPLPSKNDPLYPTTNDLERSRPPTYEQSNEFDSNKKKEKSNFADVDNDDNLDLPSVPTDNNNLRIHSQASNQAPNNNNNNQSDSCDFDELTRRFENLKSKK
jgi:hypothetical protein